MAMIERCLHQDLAVYALLYPIDSESPFEVLFLTCPQSYIYRKKCQQIL